ncbi:dynein axonemal heavy chain 14 [Suncus etruscus]|uniref:dynein axonemal heavy chain 14 n=1 Tax=Suncus etruscus TaxID=109475 RepID=UPI00210F70EB|nr:dynein axonemal heavy chain 14 [Suncus etruscus]
MVCCIPLEWHSPEASRLHPAWAFLAYLLLHSFSKGFWAGIGLSTHSDSLLQPREMAFGGGLFTADYLPKLIPQLNVPALKPISFKNKKISKRREDKKESVFQQVRKSKVLSYDTQEPEGDDVIEHIIRLRKKFGWQTILPKSKFDIKQCKLLVQQALQEELVKDDGEFVYCLSQKSAKTFYNPYDLQVVSSQNARCCKEFWTVSASFISKFVKTDQTGEIELIPTSEWLLEKRYYSFLQQFKIFSNFRINKAFITWKLNVKRTKKEKCMYYLNCHLFLADELFQGCLFYIKGLCEDALNVRIDNCPKTDASVIILVKLDNTRTYSLDEFCEEQLQQVAQASKQLAALRDESSLAIKNVILKVAERENIEEYFVSDAPECHTHFKTAKYKRLLGASLKFLKLIDYFFLELIHQLVHKAITMLLEFFHCSASMLLSVGKKNEQLYKIYKDIVAFIGKIARDKEDRDSISKSQDTYILKSELKAEKEINEILNSIQVDMEKKYAPIFQVHLHLRIPSESDILEKLHIEIEADFENKEELFEELSEFPTNLFLDPNRLDFSIKIQNMLAEMEKCITTMNPLCQDPHLKIFNYKDFTMNFPNKRGEIECNKQTKWLDCQLLFGKDILYQRKIMSILSIIGHSMSLVNVYSQRFLKYCAMTSKAKLMSMKLLEMEELTPIQFKTILEKSRIYLKQVITMAIEKRVGIFNVLSFEYQSECLPYIDDIITTSNNLLLSTIKNKNVNTLNVVDSLLGKLMHDPIETEEFAEHFTFLDKMPHTISKLEKEYLLISELNSIVTYYQIPTSEEQNVYSKVLLTKFSELKTTSKIMEAKKDDTILKFRENLEECMVKLQTEVCELKDKIKTPVLLQASTPASTAMAIIQSFSQEASSLANQTQKYASYQDRFNDSQYHVRPFKIEEITQTMLSEIYDIEYDLALRKLLWDAQDEWRVLFQEWRNSVLHSVDIDTIQKHVSKWKHIVFVLEKGLPRNNMVIHLKQSVMELKQELPIIIALENPYLMPRHWERLQMITGKAVKFDKNCTIENLVELKVLYHKNEINEISVSATNEASLEKLLFKIIDLWDNTPLCLVPHSSENYSILILPFIENIMTQLEESQNILTTAKGSSYLGPNKDLVHEWIQNLRVFSRTLEEWTKCQRNLLNLEPIFNSSEIQRQLPEETKLFSKVVSSWKDIMLKIQNKLNALRIVVSIGVYGILKSCGANLEYIKKKLEDYLDIKRMIFPRFYFLSNAELLDILANSKNPESVQPHLIKCFQNINQLRLWKQEIGPPAVKMFISAEGEALVLPTKIRLRSAVEQWLVNLEKSMFGLIKKLLSQGIEDWNTQPFSQWVVSHPGQVVLTVSQIIFYDNCLRSFRSSQAKEELEKVHFDILHFLDVIMERIRLESSNSRIKVVLGSLLAVYVYCRDIVNGLLLKNISNKDDFEWTRHLQYKWNEKQKLCYVSQGDASFTYGYEYLGCSPRLVITPLTDRCWLTLTEAIRLNLAGCLAGPAGTGKTESVKDLAKSLGKHCVVFNCFENLDYKITKNFFLGIVQSGAWCCFDELEKINTEVLSVIASQIRTIKDAKDKFSIRFVLEGKEIRINMSCAIFITVNFECSNRRELPDNLTFLFRPMSMMVPNSEMIAQVLLFSIGFKSAKSLSVKLISTYELARKQLSQQDFYDFGLKNLKTIIIMAGKKIQKYKSTTSDSLSEATELMILVEAMREISLPKFHHEDVILFEKIMADVFHKTVNSRENTIALERAISIEVQQMGFEELPAQKNKILQLYTQLQAFVGVMLVGPTGGGKTTVRQILKRALALLSITNLETTGDINSSSQITGKKAKVDTCIFNPKCITVDQLYGHLDTNTMEWKDGLLSAAVRNYVSLSSTKNLPKQDVKKEQKYKTSDVPDIFGLGDSYTKDIDDNIFIHKIKKDDFLSKTQDLDWQWIIFDGPVDTSWIENISSMLDDTKTLCLANSERIILTEKIRVIFEVDNLSHASPSILSQCAMVYMDPVDLGWEPYVKSWLLKISKILSEPGVRYVELLIKISATEGLQFIRRHQKFQPFPVPELTIIKTLCRILDAFFECVSEIGEFKPSYWRKNISEKAHAENSKFRFKRLRSFTNENKWYLEKNHDKEKMLIQKIFVFAYTWAFGGTLTREDEHEDDILTHLNYNPNSPAKVTNDFDNLVHEVFEKNPQLGFDLPTGQHSIFGYFVDIEQCDYILWSELLPSVHTLIQKGTSIGSNAEDSNDNLLKIIDYGDNMYYIATRDTRSISFLITLLLKNSYPVLLTGDSGVGKTTTVNQMLERLQESGAFSVEYGSILGDVLLYNETKKESLKRNLSILVSESKKIENKGRTSLPKIDESLYSHNEGIITSKINFNINMTAAKTKELILKKLIKRTKDTLGAPNSNKLVIFIDDLTMPESDIYGAQPPLELIRQLLDLEGVYDTENLMWKTIQDFCLIASCECPFGRRTINQRLLKHFSVFVLPHPSQSALLSIFQVHLGIYFSINNFVDAVQKDKDKIISCSLAMYYQICENMLPTPTRCHYIFNLRDVFKLLIGLLQAENSIINSIEMAALFFVHEATRVFHDRLVEHWEKSLFYQFLSKELENYFQIQWTKEKLMNDSTIFVDFLDINKSHRKKVYQNTNDYSKLAQVLSEYQWKLSSLSFQVSYPMVFFKETIEHISRVSRVLRQSGSHMLLIGVNGCGKETCAKLACHLKEYKTHQISVTHNFAYTQFREDFKRAFVQAGLEGKQTVLIIAYLNMTVESFLEDLNSIINLRKMPDFFDNEELDSIVLRIRTFAKQSGCSDNRQSLLAFFHKRVYKNLHIFISISPVDPKFRYCCKKYSSIISSCTIDWYERWNEQALLLIANSFLSEYVDFENREDLREKLAPTCVQIYTSTKEMSIKYFKRTGRNYFITPSTYLQFMETFAYILKQQKQELQTKRNNFYMGLSKIIEAANLVINMQNEVLRLGPKLEQKGKEREMLRQKLDKDSETVERVQMLVKQNEEMLAEEIKIVEEYSQEITHELKRVMPALEKSLEALNALDKADIAELRVYTRPPFLVLTVMNAVCILLQKKPNWTTAKLLLSETGFLKKLINLDKDNIPEKAFKRLKRILALPDFNPKKVALVSVACCSMCQWVIALNKYHEIQKLVSPKMVYAEEAQNILKIKQRRLAGKQRNLQLSEDHQVALKEKFKNVILEKQLLSKRIKFDVRRLQRASLLLSILEDRKMQWKKTIIQIDSKLERIFGDMLLSAACIVFNGDLTAEFRQLMVNKWEKFCIENNISLSSKFSLIEVMTQKHEIFLWHNQGLPPGQYSTENAILIMKTLQWPLVIDPHKQAHSWIRWMAGSKLQEISAENSNCAQIIEKAIEVGGSVFLQNLPETLSPRLKAILKKDIYKDKDKYFIRIGDSEIEYNTKFRLYLSTEIENPTLPPLVYKNVSIINYIVTFQALQNQLLSTVLTHEVPQLKNELSQLWGKIVLNAVTLEDLERKMLNLLHYSLGNILDDEKMIDVLKTSKEASSETSKSMEETEKEVLQIQETQQYYLPIATRGSLLYFLITNLTQMNSMYQFSLDWFHQVFAVSIVTKDQDEYSSRRNTSWGKASSDAGKSSYVASKKTILQRYLKDSIDLLTRNVFKVVSLALFNQHKLCFSFQLCITIMKNYTNENIMQDDIGSLSDEEWNIFLYSGILINSKDAVLQYQLDNVYEVFTQTTLPWLSSYKWKQCQYINSKLEPFSLLCKSLLSNEPQWNAFYDSKNVYSLMSTPFLAENILEEKTEPSENEDQDEYAPINFPWEKLTSFQRLILIKIIKPECLENSVREFIAKKIGNKYLLRTEVNLKKCYKESNAKIPLILIHTHGVDLSNTLQQLKREFKKPPQQVTIISLGRGQAAKAENLIKTALSKPEWVFLDNCHLAVSFMPRLCTIIESFQNPNLNINPQFRLWLSSNSDSPLPPFILQKGLKIALEKPQGLKNTLLHTFGFGLAYNKEVTEEIFEKYDRKPGWKKILFSVCMFNALVNERKKYGLLGWNIANQFCSSDLEASIKLISSTLNTQPEVPWKTMRNLIGKVIYGGWTTDSWDQQCLNTLLYQYCNPDVLKDDFYFHFPTDKIRQPQWPLKTMKNYIDIIQTLPDDDTPELLEMHPEITREFKENSAQKFIESLMALQPKTTAADFTVSNEKSDNELVMTILLDLLKRLPMSVEKEDCPGTQSTLKCILSSPMWESLNKNLKGYDPLIHCVLLPFLCQEIERFDKLLIIVHKSLNDLHLALKGMAILTDELDEVYHSFLTMKVPTMWQKYAYRSCKPLVSWVNDLIQRVNFFNTWTKMAYAAIHHRYMKFATPWISNIHSSDKKFKSAYSQSDQEFSEGFPTKYWFPAFFFPQAFLTSVLQDYGRYQGIPLNDLTFTHKVISDNPDAKDNEFSIIIQKRLNIVRKAFKGIHPKHIGAHVFGLFIEGARWNHEQNILEDSLPLELCCDFPEIYFVPTKISSLSPEDSKQAEETSSELYTFQCPVYQTPERSRILTTGSLSNFLTSVNLPTKIHPTHWIKMNVALLCEKEEK